jgi:lipopolysaccharide/colanic/teichoic acid biosynthesis glycosyltransferase
VGKRIFDIAVSLALLLLNLPVILLTALLIRIDSPGPVFSRQQHTGLHGRPFMLLKFRSRMVDVEKGDGDPRCATQQAQRPEHVPRQPAPR